MSPDIVSFSLWMGNFALVGLAYLLNALEPNILLTVVLLGGFSILPVTKFLFATYLKYNRKLAYYSYLRSRAQSDSDFSALKDEVKKMMSINKSKKDDKNEVGEVEAS
jgi:hypothetical protein